MNVPNMKFYNGKKWNKKTLSQELLKLEYEISDHHLGISSAMLSKIEINMRLIELEEKRVKSVRK
jgi:hypothetical protein